MDGRVVTDSRAEPGGLAKTFNVGNSEVFRCWDLAIQQLHSGDNVTLKCPANLAWGQAYTWAPVGGEPIPLGSDIYFDLEIEDCNIHPTTIEHPQPVTTTMQPDICFYLHFVPSEHTAFELVLSHEADEYAKFWPAKYAMIEHKVIDDPAQQWTYDEKTGAIKNIADGSYLDFDYGWAMTAKIPEKADPKSKVSEHFPTSPRQWFYDSVSQELRTDVTGVQCSLASLGQARNWGQVQITPSNGLTVNGSDNGKWRVEYCHSVRG
jgi:hypothetical protein